jgi:hypothetical protein
MGNSVTLHEHTRRYRGKSYVYWCLRWKDGDGVRRNESLGRTDEVSKRQAEKLRVQKQLEFEAKPTLRMSSGFTLGEHLTQYVIADRNSRKARSSCMSRQPAISRATSEKIGD